MLILVYNNDTNKIEIYERTLGQPMPYVNNSWLTVKEFRGSSKSTIIWTSKNVMRAFYTTRARFGPIYVGYAFKRIFAVWLLVKYSSSKFIIERIFSKCSSKNFSFTVSNKAIPSEPFKR